MSKETGAPAFPTNETHYEGEFAGQGITIRDYFAAKAMQGTIAAIGSEFVEYPHDAIAKDSYLWADAMLKAREE